jgi:large subunit ribosomal protein L13
MKTSAIRKHEPAWHFIDADTMVLGRIATRAADLLRGKGKVTFVANMDCGDHVVIINARAVVLTGNKLDQKMYHHHTFFPGGIKSVSAKTLMETDPALIITKAVTGMLPKNKLQPEWLKRLHVYAGAEHPHQGNVAHLQKQAKGA